MAKSSTYLKPDKKNLIVPRGRKKSSTIEGAMAGMKGGEVREGDLWDKKTKPELVPEVLDADGIARRRAITSILTSTIMPNSLSSKSTEQMDRRSLINKLNRSSLKELKRLLPDRIKRMSTENLQNLAEHPDEIPDEERVEIQNLYMDVSP